ncbi:MAG: TraR/DksA family transcriptional regulator [Ilumatobacter sp.]
MAAAKKTASKKKAAAKKTAAKKSAAKKAPPKKSAAKKKAAAKTPKKAAAKNSAAAAATGTKKRATTKMPAKKTAATKTAAKQTATKKAPAKKSAAKKSAAKKSGAKKSGGGLIGRSSLLSNEVPEVHEIPAPRGTTKDGISYTKDFDVKFLKAQREELIDRRESELKRATRLEDEAESLIEDGEMGDVQFDDEGGEGDTMVVQRDLDRVLSSQARAAVEEIDAALTRIEAGTYGYSEVSGLPIPRERLEALPETTVLAAEKVSGAGRR